MECSITRDIRRVSAENPKATEYDRTLLDLWTEISHYIPEKLGKTLDIGAAYGTYTAFLAEHGKMYSTDVEDMRDEKWFNEKNIKFKLMNLETDDIPGGYDNFDSIFLTEVLEHFNYSPVEPMKKLYKMLKTGGKLYLTTPVRSYANIEYCTGRYCQYNHYMDIPEMNGKYEFVDAHHHIYDHTELAQLAQEVGFKIKTLCSIRQSNHYLLIAEK